MKAVVRRSRASWCQRLHHRERLRENMRPAQPAHLARENLTPTPLPKLAFTRFALRGKFAAWRGWLFEAAQY